MKKIITPKKYLRFAKNTDCDVMDLTGPAAHCNYMKKPTLIFNINMGAQGAKPPETS